MPLLTLPCTPLCHTSRLPVIRAPCPTTSDLRHAPLSTPPPGDATNHMPRRFRSAPRRLSPVNQSSPQPAWIVRETDACPLCPRDAPSPPRHPSRPHGMPAKLTHAAFGPVRPPLRPHGFATLRDKCFATSDPRHAPSYLTVSPPPPLAAARMDCRTEAGSSAMQLQASQVVCGQTGRLKICQNASDNETIP